MSTYLAEWPVGITVDNINRAGEVGCSAWNGAERKEFAKGESLPGSVGGGKDNRVEAGPAEEVELVGDL